MWPRMILSAALVMGTPVVAEWIFRIRCVSFEMQIFGMTRDRMNELKEVSTFLLT